jgi:hypothetical protein
MFNVQIPPAYPWGFATRADMGPVARLATQRYQPRARTWVKAPEAEDEAEQSQCA